MRCRKLLSGVLALSLLAGSVAISASDSEAAVKKPKLKKKTVSVYKGKTAKIQIKGKKIKKTKWSVKKKAYLSLSKKKKTSVVVKGKKKGKTTVTAKVTVKGRKKAYTLKCTVKVKNKKAVTSSVPTAQTTAKPTVKPTVTPTQDNTPTLAPVPEKSSVKEGKVEAMTASEPKATSVPLGTVNSETDLNADFESYSIGDAIQCSGNDSTNEFEYKYEGNLKEGDTIDYFNVRKTGITSTKNLTAKVVDLETAGAPGADASKEVKENVSGKVLEISGRRSTAQGALLDLTDLAKPGATYEFKAYAKMADDMNGQTVLVCSTETKATQNGKESYANIATISNKIDSETGKNSLSEWQEITTTVYIPDDMAHFGFYLECYTDQNTNIYIDGVTFKQKANPNPYTEISSLKETYQKYFDYFGCGAGYDSFMGEEGIQFFKKQFNSYTAGNEMKPDAILPSAQTQDGESQFISIEEAKELGYYIPEGYEKDTSNQLKGKMVVPKLNFDTVDELLAQAKKNDIKVRMHVLTWHQQTPTLFFQKEWSMSTSVKKNVSKETMDLRLEFYIRSVMDHVLNSEYADVVYSWDVTNEYLHTLNGGTPTDNFWYAIYDAKDTTYSTQSNMKLNPTFVKLAFQIAHDELVKHNRTDISLIYNDYNTYDVSTDIVRMIQWINTKDSINTYGQICDGIGMQAHLDMTDEGNNPTIERFANTMEKFRINLEGLEIAITELDVTLGLNGAADELTDMEQAAYYEDVMRSILACKKRGAKINSVTLWSLYDGVSWRSAKTPCVFRGLYEPKAAFYALFDAVTTYFLEPFITGKE